MACIFIKLSEIFIYYVFISFQGSEYYISIIRQIQLHMSRNGYQYLSCEFLIYVHLKIGEVLCVARMQYKAHPYRLGCNADILLARLYFTMFFCEPSSVL
jgi:hypothetical protein